MQDCVTKGRNSRVRGTAGRSITPAKAVNIRVMYAKGLVYAWANKANPFSLRNIAQIYCVEDETVRGIVQGRTHLRP